MHAPRRCAATTIGTDSRKAIDKRVGRKKPRAAKPFRAPESSRTVRARGITMTKAAQ